MRYAILDTETASLTKGVCDLAVVIVDEDFNHLAEYESLIDPECLISPEAMGVHHITQEMVENEPTLGEFMEMHNFPLRDVDVVIGHNVRFDLRFLKDYVPEGVKIIDTLKLSRNQWPDAESHKLQTLRYKFKLDAGSAHRAMGDVITCKSLCQLLADSNSTNLRGLLTMMHAPLSLHLPISFGKHKGTALKDLPMSYVKWLLGTADIDGDLREALLTRV